MCPNIDKDHAYSLINSYALAFARVVLFNDQSKETRDLLIGAREIADEAVVRQHNWP